MTLFRKTLPLTLTSFINKLGSIGMSYLPMMLIERNYSDTASSFVLGVAKASVIVGTLCGGLVSDRQTPRLAILLALVCSTLGYGLLPLSLSPFAMGFCAFIGGFGTGMFLSPIRMLLLYSVEKGERTRAIAWLRVANNGASIVAFGLGSLTSIFGLGAAFFLDSATSAAGFLLALRTVPRTMLSGEESHDVAEVAPSSWPLKLILLVALTTLYSLVYELFLIVAAAKLKITFGNQGQAYFSYGMMINTLLCTLLAIYATDFFRHEMRAMRLGMILMLSGFMAFLFFYQNLVALFLIFTLITAGELAFVTHAQVKVMEMIPKGKRQNVFYSVTLVVQNSGRFVAGLLAFPLFVNGSHAAVWVGTLLVVALIVQFSLERQFRETAAV